MTREEFIEFVKAEVFLKHQVSENAINAIADAVVPVVNDKLEEAYKEGYVEGAANERKLSAGADSFLSPAQTNPTAGKKAK